MFIVFTFVEVLHVYFYLLPVQNVDVHYFFVVLGRLTIQVKQLPGNCTFLRYVWAHAPPQSLRATCRSCPIGQGSHRQQEERHNSPFGCILLRRPVLFLRPHKCPMPPRIGKECRTPRCFHSSRHPSKELVHRHGARGFGTQKVHCPAFHSGCNPPLTNVATPPFGHLYSTPGALNRHFHGSCSDHRTAHQNINIFFSSYFSV